MIEKNTNLLIPLSTPEKKGFNFTFGRAGEDCKYIYK